MKMGGVLTEYYFFGVDFGGVLTEYYFLPGWMHRAWAGKKVPLSMCDSAAGSAEVPIHRK